MKVELIKFILVLVAMLMVFVLELVALKNGIDGVLLGLTMALIALLAPSPAFQLKIHDIVIKKSDERQ